MLFFISLGQNVYRMFKVIKDTYLKLKYFHSYIVWVGKLKIEEINIPSFILLKNTLRII